MDDNAIHEWLIKCFGPIQGEMAWQQISQLPEEIREQLMSQDPSRLPNPSEVQQMMAAFTPADSTRWVICSALSRKADQRQARQVDCLAAGQRLRFCIQRVRRGWRGGSPRDE